MDKLYTLHEVADILGVSRQTIYNYLHTSPPRIKAIRYKREYRISETALNEFMADAAKDAASHN